MLKRDRELGLCEGGLDMRGHVIGPFGRMAVRTIERRYAAEKILQVMANIRIGIFLDGERC